MASIYDARNSCSIECDDCLMSKHKERVAKYEKAISKKYGTEAIDNPRRFWTDEKEKEYLEQSIQERQKFAKLSEKQDKVEQDGFLINQKLLNKNTNRVCPVCEKYSFDGRDGMYMNRFSTCYMCYIQWIDGREERWLSGWRPNKEG